MVCQDGKEQRDEKYDATERAGARAIQAGPKVHSYDERERTRAIQATKSTFEQEQMVV